jgi:mannan endo-1,4-beta-mannosidase
VNGGQVTRRNFIRTTALALPLAAAGCVSLSEQTSSTGEFVTIRNGRFSRRGKPYFFLGANFYHAPTLADPELPGGRERVVRELDLLRSIGVTNLRVMAGSEGSLAAGDGRRGILVQPGEWDEGLLQGLDFVLAEMAKRDMTGVLYLTNFWPWSGGMAKYVSWATGEPIPGPNQPGVEPAGVDPMTYAARFYGLPRAQELFREHATHLLARRNTVNGRFYYDEPAIMSWQLANEPRPGSNNRATEGHLPVFYAWMDDTARFIKQHAPRQLVSTGNEGTIGCIGKADAFLKAHQSPAVDYLTVHLWVKNWGWLKEPRLGPQYEEAAGRGLRYVEEHIAFAGQLGRPLVMEEFGIERDNGSASPDSPTAMRDDYYEKMFRCVLDSCKAGRELQGANFWYWSGEGSLEALRQRRAGNQTFREAAGSNGVLHTDRTTLAVIRQHNAELAKLMS